MSAENATLVRRWFDEVWNQRRSEAIDELLDDDSISHSEGGTLKGKAAFKAMHNTFVSAFPDLKMTIEAIIAQGDDVAVRWFFTGTHQGHHLGFPATHRPASSRGVTWIKFHDGKMVEGWDCWNLGGLMQSLQKAECG